MKHKLSKQQCALVAQNASTALYEYCKKSGIHYVVLGISGGLDSAVTLALAANARKIAASNDFKLEPVGVVMPCHSSEQSKNLAEKVINKFLTSSIEADLTDSFEFLLEDVLDRVNADVNAILQIDGAFSNYDKWEYAQKIAQGNVKARLRMITVYHIARLLNGLVLSTDNLSELWMGFWTICGDVGDFGMIQNVLKGTELYDLARYLEVPKGIIEAKPDDGLGVAGGDADQLGATYPAIDKIMLTQIQGGIDPDGELGQLDGLLDVPGVHVGVVESIAKRCLKNSFKRKGAINLTREELGLPPLMEIKT